MFILTHFPFILLRFYNLQVTRKQNHTGREIFHHLHHLIKENMCCSCSKPKKMFDLGARMTSRSLALFCVSECYKSDRAVHHFPWSCVTISYNELSLWKYKSKTEWACSLNLSTPPLLSPQNRKKKYKWKEGGKKTCSIFLINTAFVLLFRSCSCALCSSLNLYNKHNYYDSILCKSNQLYYFWAHFLLNSGQCRNPSVHGNYCVHECKLKQKAM